MKSPLVILAAVFVLLTVSVIAESQQVYEGQIDGDFQGWDSDTIYKLIDGHIIQQASYHYHYHYAYMPKVIIYQSNSGGYKIHIEDDDDEDVSINILK